MTELVPLTEVCQEGLPSEPRGGAPTAWSFSAWNLIARVGLIPGDLTREGRPSDMMPDATEFLGRYGGARSWSRPAELAGSRGGGAGAC